MTEKLNICAIYLLDTRRKNLSTYEINTLQHGKMLCTSFYSLVDPDQYARTFHEVISMSPVIISCANPLPTYPQTPTWASSRCGMPFGFTSRDYQGKRVNLPYRPSTQGNAS